MKNCTATSGNAEVVNFYKKSIIVEKSLMLSKRTQRYMPTDSMETGFLVSHNSVIATKSNGAPHRHGVPRSRLKFQDD